MLFRLHAALCLTSLLLLAGCQGSDPFGSTADGRLDFGDAYQIVVTDDPRNSPPYLDAESLHVTVRYGGGCRTHRFQLHTRLRGDTAEVWLEHAAHGDRCEALITDRLIRPVPFHVLAASRLVLLTPDGTFIPLR